MATKFDVFNDPTVPNNAIYWVQAFGASLPGDASYQDLVPDPVSRSTTVSRNPGRARTAESR